MRFALTLLVLLAAGAARGQPDFTALVRDTAAAVVNLTGGQSLVLPDLPLAEEEDDASDPEEEDEDAGVLRDFLRRYQGPAPDVRSLGSGFVIDAAGYILTNAHLVNERRDI